jgi:hypothetical protein
MLSTRLGWFGCLLIAGAMMLGAVLMLGARRNRLSRSGRSANDEQTFESIRQRVEQTESILEVREYYVSPQ